MIELKNLRAGYGPVEILHGISACLAEGKLTCIVGPNGCGKTTLLKTVPGILQKTGGEILLDGIPTEACRREPLAVHVAYLAQGGRIPDMTVGQLVLHGRFPHLHFPRRYSARDRQIAAEAMETLGIGQYAEVPLAALSGGMRQSAYLAMALAQETAYILLDEPTTYLDFAHQLSLMQLLHRLARDGKGIAAVMHDLPFALTYADEVWVMRGGTLVMTGTPHQIASCGVLREVFGADVKEDSGTYFYQLTNKESSTLL